MTNTTSTREVSVQDGYTRWAAQYDHEDNALIALEERLTLPLLATIPHRRVSVRARALCAPFGSPGCSGGGP